MENKCFQVHKSLVNEIIRGMEQVKQLRASSSSNQEALLESMLASYEEALSILNGSAPGERGESVISSAPDAPDSSATVCEVARSEVSSRKRLLPRFTQQVAVRVGTLSESLDDGYSWRKYGQKDILGSKYPRGYYRCTYRNVQGCRATKQVRRSDDDPSIFEVTYKGKHTCLREEPVVQQVTEEKQE